MSRFTIVTATIAAMAFGLPADALAQDAPASAPPADPIAAGDLTPAEMSPDELKIYLAPLAVEELEAIRDELLAALREHATGFAEELIERRRLEQAPERDTEALAALDEVVAEQIETKAELVSRANIVLAAIEDKGGDVAASRAYVNAIDALHPEEAAPGSEEKELSAEEQEMAATRKRVAELIAVVRAEPPIHERPNPWEIPVSELELEMQPLTLEEIEQRLQKWQEILQRQVRKRIRYDILLNNAEKLTETQEARADAALLAGIPPIEGEEISADALKAELAEQSQAQQQIIRAIVERMDRTIKLVRLRGGEAQPHVDYIASATGQKLNIYDPTVLYAQVRAWLLARDGGIAVGLNILKFLGVLAAFWFLSVVLGWIANAAVRRIPQASSLLRPLLVTSVRRVTLFIGFITALTMLGVNAGPLLAMIGAAGLVIGLALQGTLSNFASGILILMNRPYDVGDVIDAGGVLGKVEAMNLVSTSILTFDNQAMLVPNNQIWNGVITNITGRHTRRVDLTFGIAYSDDVARAMQILEETLKSHPKVLADPPPMVRVSELGDNSVNLIARPWAKTSDYWDVYWDLLRDVKLRFDAEGINIPFPQRDLHLSGPIEVQLSDGAPRNGSPGSKSAGKQPETVAAREPGPGSSATDGDDDES